MEEEIGEMHSEDDKALSDKNKKRTVKTPAQIQALEKYYNEHKYPTESMKFELASSIGLTEKQISGWFCHRRLKDKRLTSGEHNATTQKQDRSSGVVVQDSCGSTKQLGDKQYDSREVESGRLTPKYAGIFNRATEGSSGSSSSLRDMYNKHQDNDNNNPVRVTASRHPVPRFDDVVIKPRTGPSGYLKVKGRVENPAITAVKKQLGKNYRIDGPPLAIEFDPLPPGAFEPSMQNLDDDETYYTEEAALPTSNDASRLRQLPKVDEGIEYNSSIPSYKSSEQTSFKRRHGSNNPNHFAHPDYRHYTNRRLPEDDDRDRPRSCSGEDYGMKSSPDVNKVARMRSSSDRYSQPFGEKVRNERNDSSFFRKYNGEGTKISHGRNTEDEYNNLTLKRNKYTGEGTQVLHGENMENVYGNYLTMKENKYNGDGTKISHGENMENESNYYLTMKGNSNDDSWDKGSSRQMIKEDENALFPKRRAINERRVKMKNDFNAPEKKWEEFPLQQQAKSSRIPHIRERNRFARENMPSCDDDEEGAETDPSVD